MILRLMSRFIRLLTGMYLFLRFAMNRAGIDYTITRLQKLWLALLFIRNNSRIESLSTWQQHLLLAEELFRVPSSLEGDVVECGCYAGASTANLSLACHLVGRRLFVCDSFKGLPEPREDEKYTTLRDYNAYYYWQEGEFSPEGGLAQVKENVSRFGKIEVCKFEKGYYRDTLKVIDNDSFVLIFEDADLVSSVKDCLKHLWPKLQEGCTFYCHEPFSFDVVSLFFNKQWWKENLNTDPPGFVGSGCGFLVKGIGYTRKLSKEYVFQHGKRMIHIGSKGFDEL